MTTKTASGPLYPGYVMDAHRFATFDGWPTSCIQRPKELSKAGFFYRGFGDSVTCFHCGGSLKCWEPGDDPWIEHAWWFPLCPYVRLCKGAYFIKAVRDTDKMPYNDPLRKLASVQAVLQNGYSMDAIQKAMDHLQKSTSSASLSATDLLRVILDTEDASEEVTAIEPSNEKTQRIANFTVEKSEDATDKMSCKVCMDDQANIVFSPCGHLVCCGTCSASLKNCPLCRTYIKETITTFLA